MILILETLGRQSKEDIESVAKGKTSLDYMEILSSHCAEKNMISEMFKGLSDGIINLLNDFLKFNPNERKTASELL